MTAIYVLIGNACHTGCVDCSGLLCVIDWLCCKLSLANRKENGFLIASIFFLKWHDCWLSAAADAKQTVSISSFRHQMPSHCQEYYINYLEELGCRLCPHSKWDLKDAPFLERVRKLLTVARCTSSYLKWHQYTVQILYSVTGLANHKISTHAAPC